MTDNYGPGVENHAETIERNPGMFTSKDRRWIYETKYGNKMYGTPQGRRKRRSDAAQRVRDALLDFEVLLDADTDTFEQLADRVGTGPNPEEWLKRGMMANVAVLYEYARRTPEWDFEDIVESGVEAALLKFQAGNSSPRTGRRLKQVDVDLDYEWESPEDVAELARRFQSDEELTDEELGRLVRRWPGLGSLKQELADEDIEELEDGDWPLLQLGEPDS